MSGWKKYNTSLIHTCCFYVALCKINGNALGCKQMGNENVVKDNRKDNDEQNCSSIQCTEMCNGVLQGSLLHLLLFKHTTEWFKAGANHQGN